MYKIIEASQGPMLLKTFEQCKNKNNVLFIKSDHDQSKVTKRPHFPGHGLISGSKKHPGGIS